MNKGYLIKNLLFITMSSIFLFLFCPENGVCEFIPSDKSYNLQEYSFKVDFCQDGAPAITKIFKATKSEDGKEERGTLRNIFERDYSRDDYCAVSMKSHEEYPGGADPFFLQFEYEVDPKNGWIEHGFYSGDPPFIKWTYGDPLLVSPYNELHIGDKWGGALTTKGEYINCETCADISLSRVYEYALIGVDDITVPYGTFSGCLRIARFRGSMPDRIAWYCPGIGQAKMIYSDTGTYSREFELTSINVSE